MRNKERKNDFVRNAAFVEIILKSMHSAFIPFWLLTRWEHGQINKYLYFEYIKVILNWLILIACEPV